MNDLTDDLAWLCGWFAAQCDGEWEHEFGVAIGTLDNPGWTLRVDLTSTTLCDRSFSAEQVDEEDYWLRLWREDTPAVFHGAGSPTALVEMISRFRRWATGVSGS